MSRCTQIADFELEGLFTAVKWRTKKVSVHLNRIFRTFGANKKQKSPAINNLRDLSNHPFTLFPKSIQVVDWDRLVRSFLFEVAPKVRKIRFEYSVTVAAGTPLRISGLNKEPPALPAPQWQDIYRPITAPHPVLRRL